MDTLHIILILISFVFTIASLWTYTTMTQYKEQSEAYKQRLDDEIDRRVKALTTNKTTVSFSEALEILKAGKFITRVHWNRKDDKLMIAPGITIPHDEIKDPILKQSTILERPAVLAPYIRITNADGKVKIWQPTFEDIFANDWYIAL